MYSTDGTVFHCCYSTFNRGIAVVFHGFSFPVDTEDRREREVKHVVALVWWFHRGPASVAHEGERFASGQL